MCASRKRRTTLPWRVGAARVALWLAVFGATGLNTSASAIAQERALREEDLHILELRLRQGRILESTLFVYVVGDRTLVPVGALVEALGFPIEVDPRARTAHGWFVREAQTFSLELDSGTARLEGRSEPLPEGSAFVAENDIYVDLALLDRWFGLRADLKLGQAVLNLNPTVLLPFEERAKREATAAPSLTPVDLLPLDRIDAPYRALAPAYAAGHIDLGLTDFDQRSRFDVLTVGDLAWFGASLALSASPRQFQDARLTLMRQDPEGGLTRLGLTEIEFGDIPLDGVLLAGGASSGLGVSVTNAPLDRLDAADSVRLTGDAPPGWDFELYREGDLIQSGAIPGAGQYDLADLPILSGLNHFRIELYGPAGQRRTIRRAVNSSDALLPYGAREFTLQLANDGARLIPLQDTHDRGAHALARARYGAARNLSAGAAVALLPLQEETRAVASFDAVYRATPFIVGAAIAASDRGAGAIELSAQARYAETSLQASAAMFAENFSSGSTRSVPGVVRDRFSLQADKRFGPDDRIGVSGLVAAQSSYGGEHDRNASLRISASASAVSVSHTLTGQHRTGPMLKEELRLDGTLELSGRGRWGTVRGRYEYTVQPDVHSRRAGVTVDVRRRQWRASASSDYAFDADATALRFDLGRTVNGVVFGVRGEYDSAQSRFDALATVSFALDRDPHGGRLRVGDAARRNTGAIAVRSFEDRDGNLQFGGDDALIASAGVIADGAAMARGEALPDGVTLVENVPATRMASIRPNAANVADPYLAPAIAGVRVALRPGAVARLDIPYIATGDVELAIVDVGGMPGQGYVATLTRCDGMLPPLRVRSAFDGLALFQFVRPGCWIGDIDSAMARRLGVHAHSQVRIELSSGGQSRGDLRLVWSPPAPTGVSAPSAAGDEIERPPPTVPPASRGPGTR